jgi:aspartyl-tRNA(Asn)/glutamyl-tRNA(Gln) amidotransferase subunit B
MADYTPTIGIECHVQLKTKTKLFSAVGNDAREAPPNTLISHIDLGMPGALPVLNEKAVELGMCAAFALGTEPQKFSKFDRKHYFYPDLPMGYQITQFYNPIIKGGAVHITVDGQPKTVRIHEAHLEADAGKSTHPAGKDYSLVDLNRAGTPLLEIVSEPDMHSSTEAKVYAKELWLLMQYAKVSDASLYYGNMRFDVNVSLSSNDELGTRTETKNLNSFRSVEKAIEYEIKRQTELLNKGEKIVQETLGWDEAKQKTYSMRSKEEAHDYRYMPEPDVPPIELTEAMIKPVRDSMPKLPQEYREELKGIGIDENGIEDIVAVPETAKLVSETLSKSAPEHARRLAFWMMLAQKDEDVITEADKNATPISIETVVKLSEMVSEKCLSSTAAKEVWFTMLKEGGDPEKIAEQKNLLQVSDTGAIEKIVTAVLAANPAAATDVKNGEMKAIGFLVGQVMKESKGQANPQLAQELIKKQLAV